ncbi:two component transcriptional regulator, winged helix family [Malonomonas rubra DSM 5091]|uniref:Two component transcriptional regulator, winged helix family n=1 Tax=Malonomonas rubra DSM 5091 TaxID=1122189 RepID=A0A1M6IAX1_MALRU|nr:response regulator transcription factor [Malonomonas rubra]SHJ31575.1 two component transcriptional regulator, winged helix family [Malonomonas rubra DSM 5091]
MADAIPILLVEDEPHIAQGLVYNLREEGYQVTHVESGEAALEHLQTEPCGLVVLDLMLPGIDGLEVCRRLRKAGNQVAVLMLTARGEEDDRVAGLSEGADDYLAKPFNLKEFLLRVAGLLRRVDWQSNGNGHNEVHFGPNRIDLDSHLAMTSDGELQLTELEVKMLRLFIDNEGRLLTRGELLQSVWGMQPDTETRTLDNFIVRLRKYFEPDPSSPRYFKTVRGRGYRFFRDEG